MSRTKLPEAVRSIFYIHRRLGIIQATIHRIFLVTNVTKKLDHNKMTVVTNAEKVKVVKEMGYEDVVSFGDNKAIKAARDARLEDMVTGKATPNYNIKNVSVTVAKAGMVGFVINIGVESILSYKKWKSGKISTWEYIKEIMKSGGNAGATSTLAAGIMIPVTSTITTAGVSALVTFPISFVIATSVDKIVAPAFALGNYKKILNEAKYYGSLIEFCVSLANTMDIASVQYVGFVGQMVSQQQRFSDLAGNVISQQAIEDFEYFASLPTEEVGVIVTGMVSLLNHQFTTFCIKNVAQDFLMYHQFTTFCIKNVAQDFLMYNKFAKIITKESDPVRQTYYTTKRT